jgi:hypothetical protein
MMMTLGVDMKKDGTKFRLMPRSDAETRALSRGALKEPDRGLTGDTDKEIKGGLYDPQMTGGRDGKFWSHIELTEPVPNPSTPRPSCIRSALTRGRRRTRS